METFVQRRDSVTLRNLNLTPEGFLQTRGVVAKEGILTYYRDGKVFREYVPAETLKEAEHLDSVQGLPITRRHPSKGEVDAENAKAEMRGFTMGPATVVNDGEDTLVDCGIKLTDKAVVSDVQAGVVELSLGYKARLDMTPGTWRGQHYDAVQRKRINNHLAIVESARAGHKARLRLDSAHNMIEEEGMELVTIKIDGKDVQVPKDSAPAIESALQVSAAIRKNDSAGQSSAEMAELRKRLDTTQAELDVLKAEKTKNDSAEAKAKEQQRIDALVKERADLLSKAKTHLKADELPKLDSLDNLGVMRAVAEALDPENKLDGKSEDYIRAHFDAVLKYRGAGEAKRADGKTGPSVGELIVHGPKGGQRTDAAGEGANVVLSSQAVQHARKGLSQLHKKSLAKA
jgi:hypothetical protein